MINALKSLRRNRWLNNMLTSRRLANRKKKYGEYVTDARLNGRITYKDMMYAGDLSHYIKVGNSAIENIEEALRAANRSFDSLNAVLDMPCGHGRVLRLLATKVAAEKITACEIDPDGIEFCAEEFGCKKFQSSYDISTIQFREKFSLVWVGSLFTHLKQEEFSSLLSLLFDSLEENGVLVFTAHGNYSIEIFEQYWGKTPPVNAEELQLELKKTNGFYFAPYASTKDYGISISLNAYVVELVKSLFVDSASVVMFREKGWDNHQDVYAIKKIGKN